MKMKLFPKIMFFYKNKGLFLIFLLFSLSSCMTQISPNKETNAIFDFSDSTFSDDVIYNLDGDWEFYWDTLLLPTELNSAASLKEMEQVPSLWTKYELNGQTLDNFGYATYHTKIIVPDTGFYSLKFKRIFLACNIFVNDSLILSIGKVATNKKDFVPNRMTHEIIFFADNDTIDLTIQVANFSHKKAGILRSVKFGTPHAITKYTYSNLLYDMFIFGALGFMLVFYFILYFYNKNVISNLYFAVFLIVEVFVLILDRELIFFRIFPEFSFKWGLKIYFIATFWRPLMFVILISELTKKYFSVKVKKISIYLTVVVSVFILLTPMYIYSYTLLLMIIFSVSTLIYEIFVTGRAMKEDKYLHFAFWGLVIILTASINDSLFEFKVIKSFFSSSLAIFLFTLGQSVLLSIKNATLLNTEDTLKNRVEIENSLRIALLSTPSYDLKFTLLEISKSLSIEKISLFTIIKDRLNFAYHLENENVRENIDEFVDFTKDYDEFDVELVEFGYNNKRSISSNELKKTKYFSKKDIKSSVVLTVVRSSKVITIVYFENKHQKMSKALVEVLKTVHTLFYSLISTTVVYYNLQRLNKQLDAKVKERTKEVEKQKEELDDQNQKLDEKIQLLEEQYAIQQELNDELASHIEEIRRENEVIEEQNIQIEEQKRIIEKQTELIKSDISYASKILKTISIIAENQPVEDYFLLDLPKNIISGDFYTSKMYGDIFLFALADCTGHGVPGALMRIFSNRNLIKIADELLAENIDADPHLIINRLRDNIKHYFSSEETQLSEGLDLALCLYNTKTGELKFSAAYHSLIYIQNGKMNTLKGDRMPVGKYIEGFEYSFKTQKITVSKGDTLYLYTDGFVDQFSSISNDKFYTSNFKRLLLKIYEEQMDKQKAILYEEFIKWKGSFYQIDDVSVVGLKI